VAEPTGSTLPESPRALVAERATMRAAVLVEPRRFEIEDVAIPEPRAGQARIRIEGCGLCASNLPLWQGREWFRYPLEPGAGGHEAWGVVEELGGRDGSAARVSAGDRVAFLSTRAYAERDVADLGSIVRLPRELDGRPFPAEPLACAINVFRRSRVVAGQTIAIVGTGYLGLLLVQLAARAGARVIALSRRPFALDLAARCGAAERVTIRDRASAVARVVELTSGALCPRVIEVTGKQEPLDLASELVAVRGRLVIAGYHQDGRRSVDLQSWNWRGIDVVNAHEREERVYREGMSAAVDEVLGRRLDPWMLHTHAFPLSRISDAFGILERSSDGESREGFVKALITVGERPAGSR
jgi:threonine dehydrogenase-like Zn-dependent dehydrogenase